MAITRRDFLDGVALAVGAGVTPASLLVAGCSDKAGLAQGAAAYPPAATGLRGSHAGAFEVAHRLRDGETFDLSAKPVDEPVYDLVIVGSGISGLSAAWFWRKRNPAARILILDNHDDFGGHAKRNEFTISGKTLIGYGGTESLQSPKALFSPVANGLLKDLGVDIGRFETAFDRDHYPRRGMSRAVFFDKATFGTDRLVTGNPMASVADDLDPPRLNARPLANFLADFPLADAPKRQLLALYTEKRDFWPGEGPEVIAHRLDHMTYLEFLTRWWKVDAPVVACLRNDSCDFFAVGIDAVSANDAFRYGYPGFQGLALTLDAEARAEMQEPYIHHFPDGNASLARMLVRGLVPGIAPGHTMEDIVTAPFDYTRLDVDGSPVRIRQSATVVRVEQPGGHQGRGHLGGGQQPDGPVDVGYVKNGTLHRVQAKFCIMAGYNMMIPYIMPGLAADQAAVLRRNVKGPLTYTNVLLKNWQAWDRLKVHAVTSPSAFFSVAKLDYPVSLGEYRFSPDPAQPIVVHMVHVPTVPDAPADTDLATRYRMARMKLFGMTFADFEGPLRTQLAAMLGPGGFDADRDIAAITVNRWSHGYSYLPGPLYDQTDTVPFPEKLGRQRVGRVAIANSDAGWTAYTHAAIDQAWRAVQDLQEAQPA